MLLQISVTAVEKASTKLADYGLLGLFTFIMIVIIAYMEKQRSSAVQDMKLTISKLDSKIDAQQKEQEAQQQNHVEFIKNEYRLSMDLNRKCLDVLDEVKLVLRETRKL